MATHEVTIHPFPAQSAGHHSPFPNDSPEVLYVQANCRPNRYFLPHGSFPRGALLRLNWLASIGKSRRWWTNSLKCPRAYDLAGTANNIASASLDTMAPVIPTRN
jgi:hypothetical protein